MTIVGDTAWHLISNILVLLVGLKAIQGLCGMFRCPRNRYLLIATWHTAFCVLYAVYVFYDGGDALQYYFGATSALFDFHFGTAAVRHFTGFLRNVLGLSFLGASLIFSFAGLVGLLAFDASLRAVTRHAPLGVQRLVHVVVFLPSVSFWSSGIGKDALAFGAVGLAIWASLGAGARALLHAASVLVLLVVRPHMATLLVLSLLPGYLLHRRMHLVLRLGLIAGALGAAVFIVPIAFTSAGMSTEAGSEQIVAYIEQRRTYNAGGAAGLDLTTMNPALQMFSYLFRPLPFEAHNAFALASSLENTLLVCIFTVGAVAVARRRALPKGVNIVFLLTYGLASWAILATTTANLGIAARQKWMFAPMLLLAVVAAISEIAAVRHASATRGRRPYLNPTTATSRAASQRRLLSAHARHRAPVRPAD